MFLVFNTALQLTSLVNADLLCYFSGAAIILAGGVTAYFGVAAGNAKKTIRQKKLQNWNKDKDKVQDWSMTGDEGFVHKKDEFVLHDGLVYLAQGTKRRYKEPGMFLVRFEDEGRVCAQRNLHHGFESCSAMRIAEPDDVARAIASFAHRKLGWELICFSTITCLSSILGAFSALGCSVRAAWFGFSITGTAVMAVIAKNNAETQGWQADLTSNGVPIGLVVLPTASLSLPVALGSSMVAQASVLHFLAAVGLLATVHLRWRRAFKFSDSDSNKRVFVTKTISDDGYELAVGSTGRLEVEEVAGKAESVTVHWEDKNVGSRQVGVHLWKHLAVEKFDGNFTMLSVIGSFFLGCAWWFLVFVFSMELLITGRFRLINGSEGGRAASITIRTVLQLAGKLPLWLTLVCSTIKPMLMSFIFGVPKTGNNANAKPLTLYVIAPFFALLGLVSFLTDVHHVYTIILSEDLDDWQTLLGVAMALAISSNIQTALSFVTLFLNYYADADSDSHSALTKMRQLQGHLWFFVMTAIGAIYLPVIAMMGFFLFPVFLAYFWIMVPISGIIYGYSYFLEKQMQGNGFIAKILDANAASASLIKNDASTDLEDLSTDDATTRKLKKFLREERARILKAKKLSLRMVPLTPVLGAFIPVAVPILCRFFMGVGFFQSAVHTWQDRHVDTFVHSLMTNTNHSLTQADVAAREAGAGHTHAVLHLLIHWMQTLNFFL